MESISVKRDAELGDLLPLMPSQKQLLKRLGLHDPSLVWQDPTSQDYYQYYVGKVQADGSRPVVVLRQSEAVSAWFLGILEIELPNSDQELRAAIDTTATAVDFAEDIAPRLSGYFEYDHQRNLQKLGGNSTIRPENNYNSAHQVNFDDPTV